MVMDQLRNNQTFFKGFEDEEEVVISLANDKSVVIHLWLGYLADILREPSLDGKGWKGFTRDYHQMECAFSDNPDDYHPVDPSEYLEDIRQYKTEQFNEPETMQVLNLIEMLLEYAVSRHSMVIIQVI